ncbi:VTT domain-containing protein [Endozoicomonas montiporae]|uniref:VTT domain-containing protein n=1 Tax=Endozoicomonas montiporae CL-33 TaxID=570277 RepID=A0A142B7R8_9GAMM|nr:VTT domain-containing protein [Endozoicomonas montiporae]AMO54794.1 hypothetical protein EZMO1_0547 [Endozoicomonas montiporae CL-33]
MSFLYEQLSNVAQNPMLLALFILVGTYILEDAAILTAALLSADGLIGTQLAFIVLFLGIFSGDLGLYVSGRYLNRIPALKRFLDIHAVHCAHHWLQQKMTTTVLLVRIIPGLRLPVYVACGFFRLSCKRFAVLVFLASLLWTAVVFFGLFSVGVIFWSDLGLWKWLLMPVLAGLIVFGHKKIKVDEGFLNKYGHH